ncbi:MAG: DUF2254 domain-containing protein [Gemmatimonadales bacterium]
MHRIGRLWARLKESLWALPALISVGLATLAVAAVAVDARLAAAGHLLPVSLVAGAEGARGVLATVAGSLITVTGVVFSITIVALQLASSQYTPRILRSFRSDRSNQAVLGVLIGTFTYSLIVLVTVRSEIEDSSRFIPVVAITGALVLCLTSVGLLIYFIHHIARMIQAEAIIDRVTRQAIAVVDHLFPDEEDGRRSATTSPSPPCAHGGTGLVVKAERGGYLQAVSERDLMSVAADADALIRVERRLGEFVLPAEPLATVFSSGGSEVDASDGLDAVRRAFEIGEERTNQQDVERGVIELTDIGVRALSPGINDPTTALVCIDRLTEVLSRLGSRRFPEPDRRGPDGAVRVVMPQLDFAQTIRLAFTPLRHHGAANPTVAVRLARALARIAARVPRERAEPALEELREVLDAAERGLPAARDRARVVAAANG